MKTPGARLGRLVVGCETPHPTCTDDVDSRQKTLPGLRSAQQRVELGCRARFACAWRVEPRHRQDTGQG